jgi:hypothetical protein
MAVRLVNGKAQSIMTTIVTVACFGCTDTPPPTESALMFVVRDMAHLVPEQVSKEPRRFLARRFQGQPSGINLPASVQAAAGLPFGTQSLIEGRDSTLIILNLFEPRAFQSDSILVQAEWLVLGKGDPSFWGEAWNYALRCTLECIQLRRTGPSFLN